MPWKDSKNNYINVKFTIVNNDKKHIRPLTAYKKANPEYYGIFEKIGVLKSISKKGRENEWYWWYGYKKLKEALNIDDKPPSFFWQSEEVKNNIVTITEIGRLLLTGWYYDEKEWTIKVGGYVYKAYQRKKETGEEFNDLLFSKAVKHIRENISYYYNKENELKLYILKEFFNNELQPLLPERPEELKSLDEAIDFLSNIKKNALKKDKDFYYNKANFLEDYLFYLQEFMEENYITGYLTEEEFKEEEELKNKSYWEKIQTLEENYNELIKDKSLKISNKILPK